MEISIVRKRVRESIEQAQRAAAARRAANHDATGAWEQLLQHVAIPLMQQVSQVLKSEGYQFRVFTPANTVRLASERSADDYVEMMLDTSGEAPAIIARINRTRGRERFSDEHILASGRDIPSLTDEKLLAFVNSALAPFIER
jgi:hypothetical protein